MDALVARIERLGEEEELKAIRPELDGNRVMELLDLSPGPEVGEAMRFLLEIRLDEGLLGEEEITRRLKEWWSARA
jgi:poly(A) polymerase